MKPVTITCKVTSLGDDVSPCGGIGVELVTATKDGSVFFAIPLTREQAQQLAPAMFAQVDVTIATAGSAEAGEDDLAARVAELERTLAASEARLAECGAQNSGPGNRSRKVGKGVEVRGRLTAVYGWNESRGKESRIEMCLEGYPKGMGEYLNNLVGIDVRMAISPERQGVEGMHDSRVVELEARLADAERRAQRAEDSLELWKIRSAITDHDERRARAEAEQKNRERADGGQ